MNSLQDDKKIELWRYKDPEFGPRKIPILNQPLEGKIQLEKGSNFHIDLTTEKVFFDKVDLGGVIVYRILAD